jgi:M6 family metalloprotease-like protein
MPGVHPAPPPQHTTGSFTGLCLPIQFPDLAGQFTPAQIDAFCNQEGFSGFGNNGSVFDYFLDSSLGRLRYKNIVAPYHTASQPRAFYTDESVQWGLRAQELIREALEALVDSGFDFGPLTTDAAGFVHAINVLYAGSVDNAWSTGLWPHSASLGSFALVPGKKAADYQMCAMDTALPLGTFCHENGHMLCSFPDLYDLGQQSQGVGNYCVMSYGQGFQRNPVSVLGYLKFKAGWANTVRRITDGMTTSLGAGTNDFAIHRKNDTEYVLIENRHQAGRDAELPGSGLAIWHVDELGSNDQEVMTPAAHYECALVQADGQFDLELTPRNYGDAQDFYRAGGVDRLADDTTPNSRWWDGTPSNLEIHSVGPAGPAITFSARL